MQMRNRNEATAYGRSGVRPEKVTLESVFRQVFLRDKHAEDVHEGVKRCLSLQKHPGLSSSRNDADTSVISWANVPLGRHGGRVYFPPPADALKHEAKNKHPKGEHGRSSKSTA